MKKPFEIPNILESIKRDYENGKITIEDAAVKLYKANWLAWIDIQGAKSLLKLDK